MNKKNVILAISLMASATALVLPMSTNEKRIIRKELYSNYENNRINTATLAENGLTVLDIIDRDIQILSEHKNMLQSKVDSGKGFFVRSFMPFINKLMAVSLGSFSTATGLFAVGGSEWCKNAYNSGGLSNSWYNWGVDTAAHWNFMSRTDYNKELMQRIDIINKQNPGFLEVSAAVPVAAVISTISGLLFAKVMFDIYRYHGRLNAYVQKVQKRFERDQAIIAQLKEIKGAL